MNCVSYVVYSAATKYEWVPVRLWKRPSPNLNLNPNSNHNHRAFAVASRPQ